MKKKLTKCIITIVIAIVAVFTGTIFFLFCGIPHNIISELKNVQCNGIITDIIKTQSCFLTIEVSQKKRIIKLDVCYCSPKDDFFKYALLGDSIRKEAGQLSLIVTKRSSGIKRKFEYPYCID